MKQVACLFLLLLTSCSGGGKRTEATQASVASLPVLALADSLLREGVADTINMGDIRAGDVLRYEMMVRNDFPQPIVLLAVKTSCGCTSVDYPKSPLLVGDSAPFSFTFDSQGFSGFQLKTITITTSASPVSRRLVLVGNVL